MLGQASGCISEPLSTGRGNIERWGANKAKRSLCPKTLKKAEKGQRDVD